jgi:hypothetical protein
METLSGKQMKLLLANVEVEKLDDGFSISGHGARKLHEALENAGAKPDTMTKSEFTISNNGLAKAGGAVKAELDNAASNVRERR